MATSSLSSTSPLFFFSLFIPLLFHLLSPSHCLNIKHHHSLSSTRPDTLLAEEKTRLGSTPPSCHNKCNQCHPCMAAQVPTLPSHGRARPGGAARVLPVDYFDLPRYSNYKPLGWKCRCGDRFYNP
ncbi:hypothetical protein DM860_004741 [Cuscuta australis]|uniref:Epidermal patterning factor-like protein n=1 Tax=Cuscuta australis TaxID=267555 RepID=A0A328DLA2_9ASTE|nr:hypothetical protein DM860_004741 [Cuscuta australis]